MSKVLVLQHAPSETLGTIVSALESAGLSADYVRTFDGQPVPHAMDEAVGFLVMGGPMGVYEHPRYPFLRAEMHLIEQVLRAEKPLLGVCLGSQLLAVTLGARVSRGKQQEIGWHPVTLTNAARTDPLWTGVEPSFVAFHWHGDIFDLPSGAVSLASSALTACQAFRYGRHAYGVLFHMEVTEEIVVAMVRAFSEDLRAAGVKGQGILGKAGAYLPRLHQIGSVVFKRWARFVEGGERGTGP